MTVAEVFTIQMLQRRAILFFPTRREEIDKWLVKHKTLATSIKPALFRSLKKKKREEQFRRGRAVETTFRGSHL